MNLVQFARHTRGKVNVQTGDSISSLITAKDHADYVVSTTSVLTFLGFQDPRHVIIIYHHHNRHKILLH